MKEEPQRETAAIFPPPYYKTPCVPPKWHTWSREDSGSVSSNNTACHVHWPFPSVTLWELPQSMPSWLQPTEAWQAGGSWHLSTTISYLWIHIICGMLDLLSKSKSGIYLGFVYHDRIDTTATCSILAFLLFVWKPFFLVFFSFFLHLSTYAFIQPCTEEVCYCQEMNGWYFIITNAPSGRTVSVDMLAKACLHSNCGECITGLILKY